MANNYLEFSFIAIKNLTESERKWWEEAEDNNYYDVAGEDAEYCGPEFDYDIEGDSVWVNSGDEYGNPDRAAEFLQLFLEKFRPKEKIGFTYAYYCSKLRLDEQGGGAVVISANEIESMGTYQWLREKMSN